MTDDEIKESSDDLLKNEIRLLQIKRSELTAAISNIDTKMIAIKEELLRRKIKREERR
jgi:hypothetical protein